jgi:hypothetical protein
MVSAKKNVKIEKNAWNTSKIACKKVDTKFANFKISKV